MSITVSVKRESVPPATPEQWAAAEAAPQVKAPPKRGRLIAIEGIDGSGKSTLAFNLHGELCGQFARSGLDNVILTREPYDPAPPGKDKGRIRRALQADSKVDPYQLAIMFAADRFAHLEDVVTPALESGRDVVCDRYTLSTLAYQTMRLPEEFVFQLVQAAPKPDITVLLDMDPGIAMQRLQARGLPLESYESKIDNLIEIRDRYLDYISRPEYHGNNPVIIVAASRVASSTPEQLAEHVSSRIDSVYREPVVPSLEYRGTRAQYMRMWVQDSDRLHGYRSETKPRYLVRIDGFNTDNPTAQVETVAPKCES